MMNTNDNTDKSQTMFTELNLSDTTQEEYVCVEYLLEMILTAKQQILLRKAVRNKLQ